MSTALQPAVFFDRDGIINRRPVEMRYVQRRADFHLIPAFVDALRRVRARGYAAVVVTNQRGVGLGVMSRAALDDLHQALQADLAARDLTLDDIRVCTATEDHPDRKPNPGMLLGAAREHGLDLGRSWMIGDSESDIVAGRRAGCHTVLVAPGDAPSEAGHRVPDMDALVPLLGRILPPV